jgi:hypothetical protein
VGEGMDRAEPQHRLCLTHSAPTAANSQLPLTAERKAPRMTGAPFLCPAAP